MFIFFRNVPEATFIQGATFILESRVFFFYGTDVKIIQTIIHPFLFCQGFIMINVMNLEYFLQYLNVTVLGRWKNNLIGKIAKAGVKYNNPAISPVIRQTLQHWAYKLTEKDYLERKKQL